jgi:hypothetical protein
MPEARGTDNGIPLSKKNVFKEAERKSYPCGTRCNWTALQQMCEVQTSVASEEMSSYHCWCRHGDCVDRVQSGSMIVMDSRSVSLHMHDQTLHPHLIAASLSLA